MKKVFLFLILLICFFSSNVSAGRGCCSHHQGQNYCGSDGYWYCNDGTRSPTCTCTSTSSSTSSTTSNVTYQKKEIYGCTNSDSINYSSNATKDDGSCIKKVYGCTSIDAVNYNKSANVDDNSCIQKVLGCTDKKAINYNENANTSDQSCLYKKITTKTKKIKYNIVKKYKFFRREGTILRKGENGKKQIKYEVIKNENGDVTEKKKINEKIIKKPITKIVSTRKK